MGLEPTTFCMATTAPLAVGDALYAGPSAVYDTGGSGSDFSVAAPDSQRAAELEPPKPCPEPCPQLGKSDPSQAEPTPLTKANPTENDPLRDNS
jgi:hypothetical protein